MPLDPATVEITAGPAPNTTAVQLRGLLFFGGNLQTNPSAPPDLLNQSNGPSGAPVTNRGRDAGPKQPPPVPARQHKALPEVGTAALCWTDASVAPS